MLYIYFLERKAHYSHSNRFSKYKTFLNIFWSCYSAYLDLENTVATPYPYFILKNCLVVLIYYSLSHPNIFPSLYCALGFSSEYINATPRHGHTISFFLKISRKPLPASSTGLFKLETHWHFLPLSLSFSLRLAWRQPHQISVVVAAWFLWRSGCCKGEIDAVVGGDGFLMMGFGCGSFLSFFWLN